MIIKYAKITYLNCSKYKMLKFDCLIAVLVSYVTGYTKICEKSDVLNTQHWRSRTYLQGSFVLKWNVLETSGTFHLFLEVQNTTDVNW
jgi:hypothetical protein